MPWWWPFGQVPEIGARELYKTLTNDKMVQVVDVRSRIEWERGHIAGARSVPVHTLRTQLPTLDLDRTRPVMVICQTAHRSIPAVRLLKGAGYDARQLAGGMISWHRAALPVEKSE